MSRLWAFVFVGAGAAVLGYGIRLIRDARACANWPQVDGRILRAEISVVGRERNRITYAPNVTYTYSVAGKPYESSRLTLVPRNSISRQAVEGTLARFPVGQNVRVFHDPADPANSVLLTTTTGAEWAYPLGGLVLIGVGVLQFLRRN
jgi:hypothetical protein